MPRLREWRWAALGLVYYLTALFGSAAGLSIGGYRIDLDFLGAEPDLRPDQYREYIKSKLPKDTKLGARSPYWYVYSPDLPKLDRDMQMAEVRWVEQQLGTKFWKIKLDSNAKTQFLKSLAEMSLAPPEPKMPRKYSDDGVVYPSVPPTPFFYNCITGRGISGMTSSTNLKAWALGKEYRKDAWQGFCSPQFQDLMQKEGQKTEKEYLEKYSDHVWILRYRKERDQALKAHRRQLAVRNFFSKVGLARPVVSDEYERFIDIDREKERDQEERKGWVNRKRRPRVKKDAGKQAK